MVQQAPALNSNIIWLTDKNVDTVEGFQNFYTRFNSLMLDKKVPWILLNICCSGSEDANYSAAILKMLVSSKKPIKTQVITNAESYGIIFACVGEERVAWPQAQFMHHSYRIGEMEDISIEDMERVLKDLKKMEKESLDFMREQMGAASLKQLLSDFKKINGEDLEFDSKKAVEYNIVHKIGTIDPFYY